MEAIGVGDAIRAGISFMENIKRIKKETIESSKEWKAKDDAELVGIKKWIVDSFSGEGDGFGMEDQKRILV